MRGCSSDSWHHGTAAVCNIAVCMHMVYNCSLVSLIMSLFAPLTRGQRMGGVDDCSNDELLCISNNNVPGV
jgi:hypothetical protein